MNWQQVRQVWVRELRDQLRDRRTLFVIFILPLLMYPMLGVLLFRLTSFVQQHDGRVVLVGYQQVAESDALPPLVSGDRFDPRWFADPAMATRLRVESVDRQSLEEAQGRLRNKAIDVLIEFPPDFASRIAAMRDEIGQADTPPSPLGQRAPPIPVIYFDATRDTSQVTHAHVDRVLRAWRDRIVKEMLASGHVPLEVTQPFVVKPQDVSEARGRQQLWSKLLPLVMFVWALTGAFYPAVDLCAGEKERGTLETLLTSPAGRNNIVGGKLLTVMTFSAMSALCNMGTLALTGQLMSSTLAQLNLPLDPPPPATILWLLAGLLPMTTLFSALSLALAALARSTKEGQYYLMPLLLVSMPLLMLPLLPGIDLNLSTSLLPVTGLILVMRAAMEGQMALAGTYVLPMALVTLLCCWMAVRWAVSQFNQEEVLFRDTENFDLRSWLHHTYRHRGEVGGFGSAILCLLVMYFMQFVVQRFASPEAGFARLMLLSQLCFALPALVFALTAARQPLRALGVTLPPGGSWLRVAWQLVLAILLAVAIHPVGVALGKALEPVFPVSDEIKALLGQLLTDVSLGEILVLMAVVPAVVEEFAFRGVILSGLRTRLSAAGAVLISAAAFGFAHTFLAQSVSASLLGVVLGIIAIKSGHILPCIGFHLSYNGLHLLRVAYNDELRNLTARTPVFRWVFELSGKTEVGYTPIMVIAASLVSLLLLVLVWQLGRRDDHRVAPLRTLDAEPTRTITQSPAEESGA